MASIIIYITSTYTDIMDNRSDPRVKDWPLMSGPGPTIMIVLMYALCVKVIGPKIMEKRKPFQLRKTLIVYNLFQVIFSVWLFREIFFVMRKKNHQVSRLHVIHHGIMPLSTWFGVKFTPGGHSTFFGMLNTFVHIIMYTYYLLAAFGPQVQKYLWWKKYLTTFQMIQFVLVMVHAFQLLFIDCDYPKAFVWWIGMHAVMFYFLFNDFYKQNYIKNKKALAKKDDEDANEIVRANGKHPSNGKIANAYQLPEKEMKNSYTSSSLQNNLANRAFVNRAGDESL